MKSDGAHDAIAHDLAGKGHWDAVWNGPNIPAAADPLRSGLGNLYTRRMDAFFKRALGDAEAKDKSILELGCGGSIWLPYFRRNFEMTVAGIDYSASGCEQAKRILERSRETATIVCEDFFNPPSHMLGSFDFVYSGGVVEHFRPTARCVRAFAAYLKPGGKMITMIPNMTGLIGLLQRAINRPVFDLHVPLTVHGLKAAHEEAGLQIIDSGYFLSTGFGIMNTEGMDSSKRSVEMVDLLIKILGRISALTWLVEDWWRPLPNSRMLSPHVFCISRSSCK